MLITTVGAKLTTTRPSVVGTRPVSALLATALWFSSMTRSISNVALRSGFVPAWEALAGVGGLELGGDQLMVVSVLVGEPAEVRSDELIVERSREIDTEFQIAGLDGLVDGEDQPLQFDVEGGLGRRAPSILGHRGLLDAQIEAVEHDRGRRLDGLGGDRHVAPEHAGLDVRLEPESIGAGAHGGREPVGMGFHRAEPIRPTGRGHCHRSVMTRGTDALVVRAMSIPTDHWPTASVSDGARHGVVAWDPVRCTYRAEVDLFDTRRPEPRRPPGPVSLPRSSGGWFGEPGGGVLPGRVIVGHRRAEFVTVDALTNGLTAIGFRLDGRSRQALLALRSEVAARWGSVVVVGSHNPGGSGVAPGRSDASSASSCRTVTSWPYSHASIIPITSSAGVIVAPPPCARPSCWSS